ncbi:MAG: type II secretion system F family protein [Candidatus Omnitrophica bacterium]|nr:type II secretion system F family protein [Candidatus Omnitrophota bacterium]
MSEKVFLGPKLVDRPKETKNVLGRFGRKRVSAQNLSDLFDHVGTLLAAGIPMLQALEFSRSAIRHETLRPTLGAIIDSIRHGSLVSAAFGAHPGIFDHVVIGMLKSAEGSGTMEAVFRILAREFAQRADIRNRLVQALAYPVFVAVVGSLTVLGILMFVVPKLSAVFDLWDTSLPLATQILLGVAAFLRRGGIIILILILIAGIFSFRAIKAERRRELIYRVLMKVPFVKHLLFLNDLIQLSRTWGILLKSGVPITEAIRAGREVVWNPKLRDSIPEIQEKIQKGVPLETLLRDLNFFPEMAHSLIAIGKETGTLHESFEKIALFYDRELERRVKIMGTYLEPLLILAIGLVVGCVVIALLLPILEMSAMVR